MNSKKAIAYVTVSVLGSLMKSSVYRPKADIAPARMRLSG